MNSSNIDRTNSIHRWRVPRALFVIAVALAAFTSASGSPDFTNVIAELQAEWNEFRPYRLDSEGTRRRVAHGRC